MSHVQKMLDAMVYDGNRFKQAWLSARASYSYTRAHDGAVINDEGDTISFSRWYAFHCAVRCGWDSLWRT